jgi:hypothetical protein
VTRIKRASIKGGVDPSLRASLYPFDVDTATLDQLAFDARFANMERFKQGYAVTPLLQVSNQPGTRTVEFGRVFQAVPLVIGHWNAGDPAVNGFSGGSSFFIQFDINHNNNPSFWDLLVGTSSMTFRSFTSFGQYYFEYIVFKPEV